MSNNLKVNSKTQLLEFKRKHNELVDLIPFNQLEKIQDKSELYVVSASDFASETTVSDNFYSILETGKYYLKVPLSILNPLLENKYAYFYPAVLDETGVLYFNTDSDYITTIQVGKNDKIFTVLNSSLGGSSLHCYQIRLTNGGSGNISYECYILLFTKTEYQSITKDILKEELYNQGFNSSSNGYPITQMCFSTNNTNKIYALKCLYADSNGVHMHCNYREFYIDFDNKTYGMTNVSYTSISNNAINILSYFKVF